MFGAWCFVFRILYFVFGICVVFGSPFKCDQLCHCINAFALIISAMNAAKIRKWSESVMCKRKDDVSVIVQIIVC